MWFELRSEVRATGAPLLGKSLRHEARARDAEAAVMELTPRQHLWVDALPGPDTSSEGDGILWLVAALAQVCQEHAESAAV